MDYGLPATCMTEKQCRNVFLPVLRVGLQNLRVQNNMTRSVLHGPVLYQGLGIPSWYTSQLIEHTKILENQAHRNT